MVILLDHPPPIPTATVALSAVGAGATLYQRHKANPLGEWIKIKGIEEWKGKNYWVAVRADVDGGWARVSMVERRGRTPGIEEKSPRKKRVSKKSDVNDKKRVDS